MSLINEALKKAQKQRADEAATRSGSVPPPGVGGFGAAPPAPPRPPKAPASGGEFGEGAFSRPDPLIVARTQRSGTGMGRFALPVLVLVGVVAGGVWWLRSGDDTSTSLEPAAREVVLNGNKPVVTPAPTEAAVDRGERGVVSPGITSSPTAEQAVARSEPEPRFAATSEVVAPIAVAREEPASLQPAPMPVPAPPVERMVPQSESASTVAFTPQSVGDTAIAKSSSMAESSQAERVRDAPARAAAGGLTILSDAEAKLTARVELAPATAAAPSETVLRFLERSKVTGVRVSATDPKVLMNDRVYRINDVIDRDLQLRVIAIDTRELKFRDPQGYVYTKAF